MKSITCMQVTKRDGRLEKVSLDKIISRIEGICKKLDLDRIDTIKIAVETAQGLYNKITTEELDTFAANKCAEKIINDPQYGSLAAGICISNLHKNTSDSFMKVTETLYHNIDSSGKRNKLICDEYYETVRNNIDFFEKIIDYERDYGFDFFSIKTLERSYLIRILNEKDKDKKLLHKKEKFMEKNYGRIIERPQHMIMRVAIGIHGDDIKAAAETYQYMSRMFFTHASPTLFNAGSRNPQLSSCYLLSMDDSLSSIFKVISDAAMISKYSGGIGVHISKIRASGSLIRGTNGRSDGIIPLMKVLNDVGRYVNQGGRRKGAIATFLDLTHPDIFKFCESRRNTKTEDEKTRDLFLGLWVPDLFMKRVKENGIWSLMCPDECPGLITSWGEEYEKLYVKYEEEKRYKKQIKARKLWLHIMSCQIETGMPYLMFKDNANRLFNMMNVGVATGSNLCSEIIIYCDANEYAVCNLASICLPRFVKNDKSYDFGELVKVAGILTRNLNKIIDINFYPVPETARSNFRHRPIGIGTQGLADLFCMLDLPFDSQEAIELNGKIFEHIYYGALKASMELAKVHGTYSSFKGSPISEGKLQFHLYGLDKSKLSPELDWDGLIEDIKKYGVYNSLVTAQMPTASTSRIMCNYESIEPRITHLCTMETLSGEHTVINKYLVEKLIANNLWTKEIRDEFLFDNGSIQNIAEIPDDIKKVYKTAFEMKTKPIIDHAIARAPFIDHSQSMNIFSNKPDFNKLSASHFYAWQNQLKTGMYYLRSQPAMDSVKFGLDPEIIKKIKRKRSKGEFNSDSDEEEYIEDPRRTNEIEDFAGSRSNNYQVCEACV